MVHAEPRRADAPVAALPTRLPAPRPVADAGGARRVVYGSALASLGCLPWYGAVSCTHALDSTDAASVGRWGEALVRSFLVATLPESHRVDWVNEAAETRAPYDLTVTPHGQKAHRGGGTGGATFVEVKTTRYREHNAFELSYSEWAFLSSEPPVPYAIVRVSGAGDPRGVKLTILDNVLQLLKDGVVRLCMSA